MRFHCNFFFMAIFYAVILAFLFDFSLVFHQNASIFYGFGFIFLLIVSVFLEFCTRNGQERNILSKGNQKFVARHFLSIVSLLFFFLLGFCFHRDYVSFLKKKQNLVTFSDFQAKRQKDDPRTPKIWRGIIENDHHFNGKHYVLRMRLFQPLQNNVEDLRENRENIPKISQKKSYGTIFTPPTPKDALIEIRTKEKPRWLLPKVETKVNFYHIQWLSEIEKSSFSQGYRNYLIENNIAAIGYSSSKHFHFIADRAHFFERIKRKILSFLENKVRRYLSLNSAGLAMVLMSGKKNYLSKDVRQNFIETGTYHVLAVSGLHVGLWGTFFYQLFRLFLRFSIRSSILLMLFGALPCFIFLTAGPVSMWRAYLFSVIGGLLFLGNRSFNMIKIFVVVFFSFLFFSQRGFLLLYSLSFQLSFSAVLGIFLILPCLDKHFREKFNLPTKFFLISFVCQWATFPFSFYTFARMHLFAPFYNFFVVPPMFLFLLLLFFFILSPFAWLSQMVGYVLDLVGKSMFIMLDFPFLNNSFLHFDGNGSIFSPYPFLFFAIVFFSILFFQYARFFKRGEV